jgi:Rrf2 family protein
MLELAKNYGKGNVFLKDVAKNQEISEKYLSQLVIPLRGAGLIQSARGAHGGYSLAHVASEIDLYQIVKAVEGPIAVVECVVNPKICSRFDECPTRQVWSGLNNSIITYLGSITLESLLASCHGNGKGALYNI